MQPEKYIQDLESSSRRKKLGGQFFASILFLISFYFLGPVIHEAAHIAVLQFYDCFYRFSFDFTLLSGFHAKVKPLCAIETPRLLLFYSIGYISTLVAAGVTSIAAVRQTKGSRYLAAMGSGLFLSVLLSIGAEGDIQSAIEVLGVSQSYGLAVVLFIVIGVFISSLKTLEMFLDLEGEE